MLVSRLLHVIIAANVQLDCLTVHTHRPMPSSVVIHTLNMLYERGLYKIFRLYVPAARIDNNSRDLIIGMAPSVAFEVLNIIMFNISIFLNWFS